jgi:hypothetical protein
MPHRLGLALLTLILAVAGRSQAPAAAEHPLYACWNTAAPGTAVVYEATLRVEAPKKTTPGGVLSATVVDGLKFVNPNTFAAAFEKLRKEKGMGMSEKELEAEFRKRRSTNPKDNELRNETKVVLKSVTDTEVVLTVTDLTALDHPEHLDFEAITREVQYPRTADGKPVDVLNDFLLAGLGGGQPPWQVAGVRETAEACAVVDRAPRCTAREFRLTGTGDQANATRTLKTWFASEVVGGLAKRTVRQTTTEGKTTVRLEYTQTVKEVVLPQPDAKP